MRGCSEKVGEEKRETNSEEMTKIFTNATRLNPSHC